MAKVECELQITQSTTQYLYCGYADNATDGLDSGLEDELPPLPPSGVQDFRFVSNSEASLGQGSLTDYRDINDHPEEKNFKLQAQYASSGTPEVTLAVADGMKLIVKDSATNGQVFDEAFIASENPHQFELPTNVNLFNCTLVEA